MGKKNVTGWPAMMILLAAYAVALGAATFVEAARGTATARAMFYHAYWFTLLHLLLIAGFIFISIRKKLLPRRRWGALLLHYGLVVVLAGAMVTRLWGYEGLMHIREGETSRTIAMAGGQTREVPFGVTLLDFNLVRYPGSHSPSSYESDVEIASEGESRRERIWMNNIARVAGFRLYQTSYDPDERGTVLTVNSDLWGTRVTYTGYALLFLGLVVAVGQRGSRLRTLYARLGRGAALLFLLCVAAPQTASAQKTVDRAQAACFGRLLVCPPDGRVEPVNTYSSELLRKIARRDTYRSMNADQVLAGLIADPRGWSGERMIYISSREVARELGVPGKYVSFREMFDSRGGYRIEADVERISRLNPQQRSKTDKEYLKLDEKVNILYALFNGRMLPLFPMPDGRWLSPGDDLAGLGRMDSLLVARTLPWWGEALAGGDVKEAAEAISVIEKYQVARTAPLEISQTRIKAEIFYNRAGIFRWAFRLYLALGFALMIASLWGSSAKETLPRRRMTPRILGWSIAAVFLAHTFGIALRWYISGRAPWANAYESMVYVGWTAVLAGLLFARREPLVLALATLLGGVVLFVSNLGWLDPQITPLVPVLRSPWLMIHVSVITASYGFFGMCAMCGIASLVGIIAGRDMPRLRTVNEISMILGLVLLTLGIFFGAVWANESWGRYWGWDPKETWALVTMVVYAAITHSYFVPRLNNPFAFAAMSVAGFASVLMTFFGVNYYLSGLHSYGGSGEVSFTAVGIAAAALTVLIGWAGWRYLRRAR